MSILLRKVSRRCNGSEGNGSNAVAVNNLRLRVLCRGVAQRLVDVRRRVEEAKLDVEDIIRRAKVGEVKLWFAAAAASVD